ncbi:unnamed protein product, partial [Polarella glacialis]
MARPLHRWVGHLRPARAAPWAFLRSIGFQPEAMQRARWLATCIQPSPAADSLRTSVERGPSRSTVPATLPIFLRRCPGPDSEACAPAVLDLDRLEVMIAEARQRRSIRLKHASPRKPTADGKWLCCSCKIYMPAGDFYRRSKYPDVPIRSDCMGCERKLRQTLFANASRLVYNARSRSKKRNEICILTLDHVLDLLLHQKGRCAYSGVVIETLFSNSHWRWSLERKNNLAGYSPDNCVLIAAEFNTSDYSRPAGVRTSNVIGTAQWSAEKVIYVFGARLINIERSKLAAEVLGARFSIRTYTKPIQQKNIANAAGEFCCRGCNSYKPAADFSKQAAATNGLKGICKKCTSEHNRRYRETLRGQVVILMCLARARSRIRRQAFSLEVDDVLDMVYLQGGRCHYSGVPLQYKRIHADWRMSLERLDNSIGYTKVNCVLTAIEFNTPDYSRNRCTEQVYGTAQWSQAKVTHVWGSVPAESVSFPLPLDSA